MITCTHCHNGIAPVTVTRHGRASYRCPICERDVSLAVFLLADAAHDAPIIAGKINVDNPQEIVCR